jgi:hypothetical protein
METQTAARYFKVCGACRRGWATWDDFVADPQVRLLGLQAVEHVPDASLLVFEHGCGSSVSVLVNRLQDLLPEHPAAGWPSLRGGELCRRHCFSLEDHAPCDRRCSHVRDRDLLRLVEELKQSPGQG